MNFRFVIFEIQQFHVLPSIQREIVLHRSDYHPNKLKAFFLAGAAGWPFTDLAMRRICRETGESASAKGVALICIRLTEA
jgi:hypothetical protein